MFSLPIKKSLKKLREQAINLGHNSYSQDKQLFEN